MTQVRRGNRTPRGHQPRTLSTGSGQTSNSLKVRNSSSRVEWTSPACPNGGCAGELASGVDRVAAFGRSLASAAVDRGSRPSAAAADRGIEIDVSIEAIHEPCGLFMCTFETPNVTAVIGRNFSSVLSEDDFSLERLGQVVLSVRKVHAGGGIRSAKVNIRHIDPSRCTTPRHRSAHTFLRAHSVSPQTQFCIRRRDRRILSSPFHVRVS